MKAKFTISKQKPKGVGVSDADVSKLALKDYISKIANQELPDSKELKNILDAFPLGYLNLKDKAMQEMILFSNEAIRNKEKEIADFAASSNDTKSDKFLAKEALAWGELQALRNNAMFNSNDHNISKKDVAVSLLRLKLIEQNWPTSKTTNLQRNQLKNARVLLNKINNLTYSEATKMGLGKTSSLGNKIKPTLSDIPILMKLAEQDHKINLKVVRDTYIDLYKGESRVTIDWEDATLSKYKNKLSSLVNSQIQAVYNKQAKGAKTAFDNLDIMNIHASPSFLQGIDNFITTALFGKKLPKYKKKSVSKTSYKVLSTQKVKSAKRKLESKKLPKLPTFKQLEAGADIPLFSIQALINEALSQQIKDNMGESFDPPVLLRNQTGRFAESAKLLTLTRSSVGAMRGTYTYQKNPGQVFEPGRKLGTAKRNPKVYIEGSIRELAMAIMKRKFPGLALELA